MRASSLRYKLYLYILPMVTLACVLLASIFYADLKQGMEEALEREASNLAHQISDRATEEQMQSLNDVIKFSDTQEVKTLLRFPGNDFKEYDQDVVSRLFFQLASIKPRYLGLSILNPDGNMVYSAGSTNKELIAQWTNETIANTSLQKRNADVHLFHSKQGGILSSTSLVKSDGESIGTLILFRKTPEYLLKSQSKEINQHLFFQSFSGTFSRPLADYDHRFLKTYQNNENNGFFFYNKKNWYGYTLNNDFGRVFVFLNAKNYKEQLKELKQHSALLTITVIIAFTVIIALFVTRIIITPLKKMGDASIEIPQGVVDKSAFPASRRDEIGDLGRLLLDMAKRMSANRQREHQLAYYDTLTGLHNKQALLSYIKKFDDPLLTSNLCVWVIDVDRFKQINDIHGYTVGNKLLKELGERLNKFFIHYQCDGNKLHQPMVSKGPGDEFVVAATIPDNCSPEKITQCLSRTLANKILVESRFYNLNLFIGWEQGGNSGFEIYEKADMAMHEAKKKKYNTFRFDGDLLERARYNQSMSDDIEKALKVGGFFLNYQPKCKTLYPHELSEYEALIRWERDGELVSPAEFIPFSEDAGLIGAIDTWVSEQVIQDVVTMEERGWKDFVVSFNVSGPRLADRVFMSNFKATLKKSGINPNHLQIELTENSLVENIKESAEAIKELHTLGVGVALDDFGTGHSSLSYLRDLPIASLKIDRNFVRNVDTDKQKTVLLKHIVDMGHGMGLTVVAEGVETELELGVLQSMQCDLVQGFLLHKPMSLAALFSVYEERIARGIQ